MKRSCKNIDVTDWETDRPWVLDCIHRHKKRHDFRALLMKVGGMARRLYLVATAQNNPEPFEAPVDNIAKEAARRIKARDLNLPPIHIRERMDKSSGKRRPIGVASALQQVFDYIAVHSCADIWRRRIVPQQVSSRPGLGPIVGAQMLQRWKQEDNRAARWAAAHGQRYSKKTKYYVKLDIKKCYASLRVDRFMSLFRRDCGNPDILWLWETLLNTHHVDGYEGFLIGALISERACQYVLSFAWRYVMGLHKTRRGRSVQLVSNCLTYMDDIIITGGSRRDILRAVRLLTVYVRDELGLEIKPDWHIQEWATTPLDAMGYVIYDNGKMAVRPRVFIRARRVTRRAATGPIPLRRAQRVMSYKGYFTPGKKHQAAARRGEYTHTNSRRVIRWMRPVWDRCAAVISAAEKRKAAPRQIGA